MPARGASSNEDRSRSRVPHAGSSTRPFLTRCAPSIVLLVLMTRTFMDSAQAWSAGVPQVQSKTTLPDWPLSMTSKPRSNSVEWNRCVITGRMSSPLSSMTVIWYQVSYISRP
jgi:hypothetical protein